ncbi:MAG: DUF5050 domain-containing protein [Clostridia bacterium]
MEKAMYTGLINQSTACLTKADDMIYYAANGDLKAINEETKESIQINKSLGGDFVISGGKLYHILWEGTLMVQDLQTREEKEIASYADTCIVVEDERIYGAYDAIVSMNLQTGEKRVLKTLDGGIMVNAMAEYGGQLYFVEYLVETRPAERSFYRIDLETGEIYDWEPFYEIIGVSESGEDLYFYYHEEHTNPDYTYYSVNSIYRIKKDGTGKEELCRWEERDDYAYAGYMGRIRCIDEWIIYMDWRDDKVYKMNQFGKEKVQLPIERELQMFTSWEDKLYYTDMEGHLYENDLSGENEVRLN